MANSDAGNNRVLRVGMIGCGEIAYYSTGPAIRASRSVEMVVAMDPLPEIARSFGETFQTRHTTSLEDVLSDPRVDAVVISAPHFQHEPLTIKAAAAGKHVMCEKPIACNLQQADRMIEACKNAGVLLGVNMVGRYDRGTITAKGLIDRGVIGDFIGWHLHLVQNKPDSYWSGGYTGRVQSTWRRSWREAGGGILMMNVLHELDRVRFITGCEIAHASAELATFRRNIEVEDHIAVNYRFDNGAIGTVTASSCAHGNRSHGVRIFGSHGQIDFLGGELPIDAMMRRVLSKQGLQDINRDKIASVLRRWSLKVFTTKAGDGLKANRWNRIWLRGGTSPRRAYVERFADAVFAGTVPDIPGEEGRRVLKSVLLAYDSAKAERSDPVTLLPRQASDTVLPPPPIRPHRTLPSSSLL